MLQLLKKLVKSSYTLITLASIGMVAVLLYSFPPFWRSQTEDNGEVRISFADDITPTYRKVIAMFNEEHHGKIRVETINIPFSKFSTNERKELFARFFRTENNQVDVFSVDEIWTARFAKWCYPLGRGFPKSVQSGVLPVALKSCYFDSTLVALPFFVDVGLMYYRKDLIDRLPNAAEIEARLRESITWQDFIKLGKSFSPERNPFYIFQADSYEGLVCSFTEMTAGLNDPLYSGGEFRLQSTGAERALSLMVDLVNKYRISPEIVTQLRESSSYRYYVENNGVFLRGWPNYERDLGDSAHGGVSEKRWGMAPVPHFAGYPRVSILGGWDLMISRYSEHKAEALSFVKFLMSKKVQEIMYEDGGYLPTNESVYEDDAFLERNPNLKFYIALLKTGVHRPSLVDYTRISDVISYYVRLAIMQKMSPRAALAAAAKTQKNDYSFLQ